MQRSKTRAGKMPANAGRILFILGCPIEVRKPIGVALDYSFDFSRVVSPWFTFPSTVMSSRKLSSFTKLRPTFILISFKSAKSGCDEPLAVEQQRCRVAIACSDEAAGRRPGAALTRTRLQER